ncbi:MAG: hypothetical protein ACQETB_05650 [Halobacteriota archaeon]
MLLVVAYAKRAREDLRNTCRRYESEVVDTHGRIALFEETELAAFLLLRLRTKHGDAIQVQETQTFNEFERVPERIIEAVQEYERRQNKYTPYHAFASATDFPSLEELAGRRL